MLSVDSENIIHSKSNFTIIKTFEYCTDVTLVLMQVLCFLLNVLFCISSVGDTVAEFLVQGK